MFQNIIYISSKRLELANPKTPGEDNKLSGTRVKWAAGCCMSFVLY